MVITTNQIKADIWNFAMIQHGDVNCKLYFIWCIYDIFFLGLRVGGFKSSHVSCLRGKMNHHLLMVQVGLPQQPIKLMVYIQEIPLSLFVWLNSVSKNQAKIRGLSWLGLSSRNQDVHRGWCETWVIWIGILCPTGNGTLATPLVSRWRGRSCPPITR